jgi:hypothetical protein
MHHLNTLPSRSVMGSFAFGQHLFTKFTPLCCPAIYSYSTRCVGHAVCDVAVQFIRLAVQCSGGGQIAAQPVTRHHRSSFTAFLPGRAPLRFQACCAEPWCCKGLPFSPSLPDALSSTPTASAVVTQPQPLCPHMLVAIRSSSCHFYVSSSQRVARVAARSAPRVLLPVLLRVGRCTHHNPSPPHP